VATGFPLPSLPVRQCHGVFAQTDALLALSTVFAPNQSDSGNDDAPDATASHEVVFGYVFGYPVHVKEFQMSIYDYCMKSFVVLGGLSTGVLGERVQSRCFS
jgi:hypothetical protein